MMPYSDYADLPDDVFDPAYEHVPLMAGRPGQMEPTDIYRRRLIGYRGRATGVMLAPEWGDALEFENENENRTT